MDKRGGFWQDNIGWLIFGVLIIIFVSIGYFIFSGKASSIIEFVKNLFTLRR